MKIFDLTKYENREFFSYINKFLLSHLIEYCYYGTGCHEWSWTYEDSSLLLIDNSKESHVQVYVNESLLAEWKYIRNGELFSFDDPVITLDNDNVISTLLNYLNSWDVMTTNLFDTPYA